MKLRVESQKPVKLNTNEQTNAALGHSTTIQPLPVIQIGTVETLAEGEEATASISGDPRTPELNLGIPVGATGARGADGSDGESAGFGTPTVTVTDLEHGDPATVSITASGPDTAKVFAFSFGIPAGPKGDPGDPATGAVTSVNGKTGAVVLVPSDIGAQATISDLDTIRTGAGLGATALQSETDPTVPAWAKAPSKPTYTASEVGALPSSTTIPTKTSDLENDSGFLTSAVTSFNGQSGAVTYTAPVTSVNGQTGAVTLTIPTVPTDVSSFNNDAGYLTLSTLPIYSGGVS